MKIQWSPKATCRQRFCSCCFSGGNPREVPEICFFLSQFKLISVAEVFFFFEGVRREFMTMTMTMMILNVIFFSFFECSFFCMAVIGHFFLGLSTTMVQKSRTTRLMIYFGGCISQLKWVNLWNGCEKPKPFSSFGKVVIHIFN